MPDWNRLIMNTMRNACEAVESWPRFFAEMRSFTKCCRNEDCRVTIQVCFRTSGQNAHAPIRSFTVGFAKWRRLFSKAFWEHSTTRNQLAWMRRARTSSCCFSFKGVSPFMQKPDLSDNGAVDAAFMRQSCCVDKSCVREEAHAFRGCFGHICFL